MDETAPPPQTQKKESPQPQSQKIVRVARSYNRYNIYFMLEREKHILDKGGATEWSTMEKSNPSPKLTAIKQGCKDLNLPPLPSRFAHLSIPEDWCDSERRRNRKRKHRKSHGLTSFSDMARTIAASWKVVDDETMMWCTEVEKILKKRQKEKERKIKEDFLPRTQDSPPVMGDSGKDFNSIPASSLGPVDMKRYVKSGSAILNHSTSLSPFTRPSQKIMPPHKVTEASSDAAHGNDKIGMPIINCRIFLPHILVVRSTPTKARTIALQEKCKASAAVGSTSPQTQMTPLAVSGVSDEDAARATRKRVEDKANDPPTKNDERQAAVLLPPGWKAGVDRRSGRVFYYRRPLLRPGGDPAPPSEAEGISIPDDLTSSPTALGPPSKKRVWRPMSAFGAVAPSQRDGEMGESAGALAPDVVTSFHGQETPLLPS